MNGNNTSFFLAANESRDLHFTSFSKIFRCGRYFLGDRNLVISTGKYMAISVDVSNVNKKITHVVIRFVFHVVECRHVDHRAFEQNRRGLARHYLFFKSQIINNLFHFLLLHRENFLFPR